MSRVILDDHLLRDLLADEADSALSRTLADNSPATTNLYLVRLCRSVVRSKRVGRSRVHGRWLPNALSAIVLSSSMRMVQIVPMRSIAFRMAELAATFGLSSLGAEAVAAAEFLAAAALRVVRRSRAAYRRRDGRHRRGLSIARQAGT